MHCRSRCSPVSVARSSGAGTKSCTKMPSRSLPAGGEPAREASRWGGRSSKHAHLTRGLRRDLSASGEVLAASFHSLRDFVPGPLVQCLGRLDSAARSEPRASASGHSFLLRSARSLTRAVLLGLRGASFLRRHCHEPSSLSPLRRRAKSSCRGRLGELSPVPSATTPPPPQLIDRLPQPVALVPATGRPLPLPCPSAPRCW